MGWSFAARSTVTGNADLVGIEAGAFCTVRAQTLRITGNDKLAYIRAGAFSGSVIELLYVPTGAVCPHGGVDATEAYAVATVQGSGGQRGAGGD
jgi:hypothetical protein